MLSDLCAHAHLVSECNYWAQSTGQWIRVSVVPAGAESVGVPGRVISGLQGVSWLSRCVCEVACDEGGEGL